MINPRMACSYFPTTVLFIDDNSKFLRQLKLDLNMNRLVPLFYNNPFTALQFLEQHQPSPFIERCLLQPRDFHHEQRNFLIDISKIHEEIYHAERFNEISVLVVDYAMPGMTGIEFIQKVKLPFIKIILLTGEADAKIAVDAFNDGIIHQFIRKDQSDFKVALNSAINTLQEQYFQDLSETTIDAITKTPGEPPSCLNDPTFIEFFNDVCKAHPFTEYYLTEPSGSFVFLDEQGLPSRLLVKGDEEMQTQYELFAYSDEKINDDIINALKNRRKVLHAPSTEGSISLATLAKQLYQAETLEGENAQYHYAYISTKNLLDTDINPERIVSFQSFLDNVQQAS